MKKLVVTVELIGGVLGEGSDPSTVDSEVARLLAHAAGLIMRDGLPLKGNPKQLRDGNGYRVGRFQVIEED